MVEEKKKPLKSIFEANDIMQYRSLLIFKTEKIRCVHVLFGTSIPLKIILTYIKLLTVSRNENYWFGYAFLNEYLLKYPIVLHSKCSFQEKGVYKF